MYKMAAMHNNNNKAGHAVSYKFDKDFINMS
jgi:hypothetical protein